MENYFQGWRTGTRQDSSLATRSVVCGLVAASTLPGHLLEMQILQLTRTHWINLHLNKILKRFLCVLKSEMHWPGEQVLRLGNTLETPGEF